jgi:hypothetical protein
VTVLSRGSIFAMAREATPGTYLPPTFTVPWTACSYATTYVPLKDQSVRNNDAILQGVYQGPGDSQVDVTLHGYPDILGNFLRMLGTDTVTAATSTTLSASTAIGATSISTAVTIPAQTMIQIDTAANVEYAYVTAVSGAGPYTLTVTTVKGQTVGLTKGHLSAVTVVTQTTHTFKQNAPTVRPPAWSVSIFDGVQYLGFAGSQISELALKIDPKATVTAQAKLTGFPEAVVTTFTYAGSNLQPELGWGWNMTNGGASSDRGLTLDLNLKRAVDPIHSSNGVQAPREVFPAALEVSGSYKAIYESAVDYNLYLANTQLPTVANLQKAVAFGGESVAITLSQSAWPKGTRSLGGNYVEATFDLEGIYNATDAGVAAVVLKNWVAAAY